MRKFIWFFIVVVTMGVTLNATTPTYENVTKLYVATFDRIPDVVGLKYWVNDSALDLEGIARSFFDQPETKAKYYPNNTIEVPDFIDEVYINLFDHLPDSSGKEYWTNDIMNNGFDYVSVFILTVINGAQGNDAVILANKTKYAMDAIRDQLDPDEPDEPQTCSSFSDHDYSTGDGRVTWYCQYNSSSTNNRLFWEQQFVDGVNHGPSRMYYPNGDIQNISEYWNGHPVGTTINYAQDGSKTCRDFDSDGKSIRFWYDC